MTSIMKLFNRTVTFGIIKGLIFTIHNKFLNINFLEQTLF